MSGENKDYFTEMVKLIIGLGIIAIVLVFALRYVLGFFAPTAHPDDPMVKQAIEARLKPIETVAKVGAAPAAKASISGEEIVKQTCSACHAAGVLNAPKIGDKAAWEPRIKANGGLDGLVQSATKGKGNMPPKGGNAGLSAAQLRAAIQFMTGL